MEIEYRIAHWENPVDAQAVKELVNCLASDPVGGGEPLSPEILDSLVPALSRYPTCFCLLAMDGDLGVGMSLCFESLSSFKARPVVNIHDFVIRDDYRGQGIARNLLRQTEAEAYKRGACKLTLEVLEGNPIARKLYNSFGFRSYELDPANGVAHFWEKPLADVDPLTNP